VWDRGLIQTFHFEPQPFGEKEILLNHIQKLKKEKLRKKNRTPTHQPESDS